MTRIIQAGMAALTLAAGVAVALGYESGEAQPAREYAFAQAAPGAPTAGEAAGDVDARELKALTEQVLQSLGAVATPPARPKQPAPPPGDYQSLMRALTTLVEKATRQGKTSEDILALIEEALANEDEERLNALIEQAGGRLELRQLLQALVQKAALGAAPADPYVRALQEEGLATRLTGADTAASDGGASSGGGRTIRVEPGDTLGIIALRVYGDARKWRDIYEANRDRLDNPDLVPAGITLRLP